APSSGQTARTVDLAGVETQGETRDTAAAASDLVAASDAQSFARESSTGAPTPRAFERATSAAPTTNGPARATFDAPVASAPAPAAEARPLDLAQRDAQARNVDVAEPAALTAPDGATSNEVARTDAEPLDLAAAAAPANFARR